MNTDKNLEYIKILNALSETFGESEGQSPDDIRTELREEGFDIESAENELIQFQKRISMAARRQVLDEAKYKRENISEIKKQMIDTIKEWSRDQVMERLKNILSTEPEAAIAYRDLNTREDEDMKQILIDLELAKLVAEKDSNVTE